MTHGRPNRSENRGHDGRKEQLAESRVKGIDHLESRWITPAATFEFLPRSNGNRIGWKIFISSLAAMKL